MNAREIFILRKLEEIYPNVSVPLIHRDAFSLLVAVILSAQCTDERVNKVTPLLFKAAATPFQMAKIPQTDLEKIIHPCGLFKNKAKFIIKTSELLVDKFQGQVPNDLKQLETLPGVGHKTASVIISQCFNGYAFPVDTHIKRLSQRWQLSASNKVETIERDLKNIFPKETWHDLHIRMIKFGREFCPSRGHHIERCPICSVLKNFD